MIDQFLRESVNKRTDVYGGSIENRSHFVLEVMKAVTDRIGSERTGIRFTPWKEIQRMADKFTLVHHKLTLPSACV